MKRVGSIVVSSVCMLAVAACGGTSSAAVSLPPDGASASVVLDTYLRALVASDCTTAHALAASSFSAGNGELCGDVKVSAFSAPTGPATLGKSTVEYASDLTTGGSKDGSIAPGNLIWFYQLKQQGGEWRLVSGGSGP